MLLFTLKGLAKQEIKVVLTNGIDENGTEKILKEISTLARLELSNSISYEADGKKVKLNSKAFIFEKLDAYPEKIKGFCYVDNEKYIIVKGSKKRNPNGSANHIVLELM